MKVYRWVDMTEEKLSDTISRKMLWGDREMLSQIVLKKGAIVPEHSHESEQISYVVEGALKFWIDGKEMIVRSGEVIVIPSRMPHSAEALEDTLDLDAFSPVRHDWIAGDDTYLRGK